MNLTGQGGVLGERLLHVWNELGGTGCIGGMKALLDVSIICLSSFREPFFIVSFSGLSGEEARYMDSQFEWGFKTQT